MRAAIGLTAVVAGVASLLACTALKSPDDTCGNVNCLGAPSRTVGPAGSSGAVSSSDPDWSCIDNPLSLQDPIPSPVHYMTGAVDYGTNNTPQNLTITLCSAAGFATNLTDPTVPCGDPTPISLGPDAGPTANVNVTFPARVLADNLFVNIQTDHTLGVALFSNRPLEVDFTARPPLNLVPVALAQDIANRLGHTLNPALGLVLLRIYDCKQDPATGVYATLQEETDAGVDTFPWAFKLGTPVAQAPLVTDQEGGFGFANVSVGQKTAHVFRASDNMELADATFFVRPALGVVVDVLQNPMTPQ